MSIFDFLTLFGGLAMFLYGMRLMGDGLKESSSGTLKKAMESVTNNQFKAFLLGLGITAIIQSSTATIVITSGLVGAGLLTLHQSIGIIIGANVGTTVTGQIIRLLDLDTGGGATSWLQLFKPSSLAPIALIIGIIIIMGGRLKSSRQIGNIAIGFGILFSGLMNMEHDRRCQCPDRVRHGGRAVHRPWQQPGPRLSDRSGRRVCAAEFIGYDRYSAGLLRIGHDDI